MTRAEPRDDMPTPAGGPVDWMVIHKGLYVLRIERKDYIKARADARTKLAEHSGLSYPEEELEIVLLSELLDDPLRRDAARAAVLRVYYLRAPSKIRKPDPTAALEAINKILSSKKRWNVKTLRAAIAEVSVLLVDET